MNNLLIFFFVTGLCYLLYAYLNYIRTEYRIAKAQEIHERAKLAFKRIAYIGKLRKTLRQAQSYIMDVAGDTEQEQNLLQAIEDCLVVGNTTTGERKNTNAELH